MVEGIRVEEIRGLARRSVMKEATEGKGAWSRVNVERMVRTIARIADDDVIVDEGSEGESDG